MFSFNRIDQDPIGTTPQQSFANYMTALYAHVNSAEDKDLATHAKKTLGDLPAYSKEQDLYIGRAIVSQAGYTGNPYSYLHNNKLPIPENALSEQEIYQHIGKEFVTKARTSYAQAKTEAQETASKQTAAIKNGLKTLPAILAEDRLPNAKEMAELTNAQLGDRFHKIFGDVFEAIELCKTFNPVTEEDIAAEIINIKAKERQDYINQNKFAGLVGDIEYTPRHDDAYYTQQAHANKQQGYKLTRGQMKSIIAALKDEQGKLDPAAVSLFIATLNEKVNKQKTIDSAFWRNFTQGAVDYFNDTTDFAVSNENTLIATTGSYLAPDGEYRPATQEQIARAKEWVNTYGTPEIETLRAGLNSVHENAFDPADQAKWYAALNTKVGSIAGREAFPLAASVIATRGMGTVPALLGGGAVGGITRYPSIAANDISQAYAENLPNPRAYGTISAAPEAFVESIFSAATGIGWGKAGIEAAANAALSVPALARAAGTVQSSALLRWATGGAAETIGELFIEDPATALTNKAIFHTINTLAGHDVFAEPEWSNVTKALTANTEDPRNAAAIAAYSFILGAFGIGGDLAKAHQFARNREALLTAGHSQNAATEISRRAEKLSEKLSTIAADRDLSAVQKYQQQNKLLLEFNSWQQEKLRSDILDADFENLRKRYQDNNLAFMEKTQAIHAIRTGAADAVLKQDGIQKSELAPNGNRILTLTYTEQNEQGAEEIKTENIELSEPQYLNYIAARTSQNQRAAIVAYQNAALGNAAVRKARTTESIAHDLINMRDLAAVAPAYQYISQRGALDYQGALLIAKSAKALHDTLIAQGMTIAQANAAADPTTGARLDSLINLPSAIKTRVESAAETTEGKALGIENTDTEVGTVALRLPSAKSLGDSIVLYIGGEATLANIAEELTESDLIRALNTDSVTLDTLKDNLTHLQTELREYDPNIKLLPSKKKENLTFSDIVEAYSTLQHLDILTRADRFNLTENSRAIIDYSLAQTDVARLLRTAADAWATFANSERGQHYLTTTGKTLSDLLDAAGMQQSKLYSDLRTAEEDRIATETAANFSIENLVAEQQKQLDNAAKTADQAAQTNTEAGLPRTEIPAEESHTGEPLTVDPLETADNNPATAEYNPATLTETTTDPRFISPVTKSPLGITGGMMPPTNLKPHPALTNTQQVGAADFSPHYNPNAKPILALRMPDGSNLIVAGRTRHQIALADKNCKAVKVTLIDYDPAIHTDEWVQMTNAGEHIINRTATTEHFRTYFTHNPITHAQAIEQGLVPIDPATGQPSAAYTKGRQLAIFKDGKYSHASGQEPDVLTGEVPINIITHSPEVPQFKTNRAGNPAGQDGVVYALPGEYRTHDPIHLWQRKDGTVVIISGRHRLAKAIAAGATHIPSTVFPETDIRNATWARVHDAEQNVLDNQASVADTALYVKGYNPKGRPLTEEESKQFTRKGSNSELGSYIGLHGSDTLIEYLSRGAISPEYAYKIAQFAPDDPDTQNLAVAELVNLGKGIQEALTAAGIYRDTRNNRDDSFAALFQSNQQEEDFNRFLASYAASKIRTIGLKRRPHKAAASERSVREHQEAGIKFENVARNRAELATLTAEQDKWRNPGLHPELRQEAYEEFKKTAEGAQDYFNFGTFSVIGPKALTWSKYVSRSFIGRDDGLPRAEIDSSQFKFHFGKDRGETISKNEYTRIVKKMCVDMLEKLHQKGITEYNEKAKTILEEEILETILPPDFVKAYYSSGYKTFTRKNAEEYAENNAHLYLKEVPKKVWKLEDVMDAPELYAAYPQLRDILVMDGAWKLLGLSTGAYINNTILLNNLTLATKNDKKKTILHEIQHKIQEIEGFAFGSSPENAFSDLQNAINRETPGSPRYKKLKHLEKRYKNSIFWQPAVYLRILTGGALSNVYDSQDIYERSAGEIEARNVEARSNWSAKKRERIPFNQTLNFSAEEAIVSSPATFSLRRSTVRNWKTLLSERERTLLQTADYINRQAQRTARVLGADTEAQRAGVHFAQATAIITALDKYIFSQDYITRGSAEYRKLRALRNYAEQYISVARKGKLPTRRATKDGRITVKAAIRELLENQLPEARETAAHTIEKKGGNQKTEKELTSELIARLANQNATEVIAEMLQTMGDIIHTHLRNSILDRITTSLKTLRPKTNPYGRAVRNTIDADTQYRLGWVDTFLNLTRAERATWEQAFNNKEQHLDQLRQHLAAPPTERQPLPEGAVKAAYDHLASRGGEITIDRVQDEVASLEYAFQSYAYLDIGTYQDALQAFLRLNRLVLEGRHGWDAKLAAEREQRQAYIDEAIAAVGESKAKHAFRSRKKESAFGSFFDSIMSAGQLFESLTETDGFRSIARDTLIRISNASPAILQSQKETENALVEAWLRLFKPSEYAALPINTASRNKAIRKHLERGFNDFVVDMQKEIETDITLEHELAPSVQAVRERQGDTAPQDFGEKLILSKGQILNILLTAEQPEYQKNMNYHGYTQAVQDKLRTLIGEEYIQFGYAMRTLLLNSGVAEVYAERTGHNLPDNPYYWPASIDHITHTKGDTKPDEDNKFKPASSNTFLKRRVVSMGEVKGVDALTVFRSNMAGRMNYIHMQPIADTWHSLLANPHFAHRLEATIGSDRMQKLKTALDVLINSAWGDTQLCGAWAKFCSTLQSARAISLLSGNIGTLVRQLTAVNHVGMQHPSGTAAYAKAALLAIQGKSRMSISQMMRSATFQARMQGNKYYEELLREGADASWNKLKQTAKNISGLGMDAIAAVDAAANAFSATVLYNIKHDYYSKSGKGYTEQEIHERCMQDVNIMLELCSQPLLQHQKSLLMATTTNAAVKAMGFMTTELLNKLGYARARYLKAGGGWKGTLAFASAASAIGIPTAIIGMLLQYATDDIPDDEIDKWAWITSNAIQGVTGVSVIFNLPLIGDYFGQFFNPHTYGDKLWDNILPDVKNTHKHYGELLAMMTTNNSWTNADLAKTINQCARDTAQLAAQSNAWIPILKEYTSTVSAVAHALAAGSNLYAQSYNLTAWTRTDKRIPNSKNNTRKQAYRQSSFEKTLTNIISDDNYEKRKAAAKRERSRNTRRQNAEEKNKK